jgi:hypothetical protein
MGALLGIGLGVGGLYAVGTLAVPLVILAIPAAGIIWPSLAIARAFCRWRKLDVPGDMAVITSVLLPFMTIFWALAWDLVFHGAKHF